MARTPQTEEQRECAFSSPTDGELECLKVLWAANKPLKLSEIREGIARNRSEVGLPPLALTTVSTNLRRALYKSLLEEMRRLPSGEVYKHRKTVFSAQRSSRTAYLPAHSPSEVFAQTFQAMIEAYPADQRQQAVLDVAKAAGMSQEFLAQLDALLKSAFQRTSMHGDDESL